jgi:hypothetical protein
MDLALLGLHYIVILTLILGLAFTLGIVWRTEKKLDLTYKCMFVALLAFLGSRAIGLGFFFVDDTQALIAGGLDFLGVFFLLLSILEMRDIVRSLDREKS